MAGAPDKVALLLFFFWWYAGNTKYNEYNKGALDAVGGKGAGMTMIVSTMQLGVCAVYALLLWIVGFNPVKLCGFQAPDAQKVPASTAGDIVKTMPVGFCAAAAHSASVFALGGDPLFGQIVKAAEPVLSAIVSTIVYKKPPSVLKCLCLPVIAGGVAFASLKKIDGAYALKFDMTALQFGLLANLFAAFKGNESKKLMTDKDIKGRYGGVGNQYAVTEILAFLFSLPVMFASEGAKFADFVELFKTSSALQFNLVMSGMMFYLYNELATMTIKATGAVTSSVANTAKRVIVLVFMSAVTGKKLTTEQKIGAAIAIAFVMLYSVIDDLVKKVKEKYM
jgi:solute carrier family 35 protein E1